MIDLIADFLEELFGGWSMSVGSRKRLYKVRWGRFTTSAPENRIFHVKAKSPRDAVRKVYKKLFSWGDRRSYLQLVFSENGDGLVQIVNTNRNGWFVGHLVITEE